MYSFEQLSYDPFPPRPVKCLDFTSDGLGIVSGSDDTSARVWDLATGTSTEELRGHTVRWDGRGISGCGIEWAGG